MFVLLCLDWDTSAYPASVTFDMSAEGGVSSVTVGDFNNDGKPDLAVGCSLADYSGRADCGAVYLFYGPVNFGQLTSSDADVKIYGESAGDFMGVSLACGDLNGDGVDDLAIGAPGIDYSGNTDCGGVFVVFGNASLPSIIDFSAYTNGCKVYGEDAYDMAGTCVLISDVAGFSSDPDLVVGAPGGDGSGNSKNDCGQVHVVSSGISPGTEISLSTAGYKIYGANPYDACGFSLASGDVNGDGLADLIMGAPFYQKDGESQNQGAVYVVFGRFTGDKDMVSDYDQKFEGEESEDCFGWDVFCKNVVTTSSSWDIIVGAPFFDYSGRTDCGACYVVSDGSIQYKVYGGSDSDMLGFSVAGGDVGDSDTDSTDDLIMSSPGASGSSSESGAVFVKSGGALSGSLDLSSSEADFAFYGDAVNCHLGGALLCENLCTQTSTPELFALSADYGFIFDTDVPVAPGNLVASSQATGVSLSWAGKSCISEGYNVYRDGTKLNTTLTTTTSYIDSGVSEGSHEYYVRAFNSDSSQESPDSDHQTIFFIKAPTNLVANVNGDAVDLTWDDNSGIEEEYRVYRSLDGVNFSQIAAVSGNTYTDLSPPEGQLYYRVAAYDSDSGNLSDYSNTADVFFIKPPTGLSLSSSGNNINLEWNDNSSVESGYKIERSEDGVSWSVVADVGADQSFYTDSPPTDGQWYYRVRAYKGSNYSSYSSMENINIVFQPTDLSVTGTASGLLIDWDYSGSVADKFKVWRSSDGVNFTFIGETTGSPPETQYEDTGVPPGEGVFWYRVVSVDEGPSPAVESDPSEVGFAHINPPSSFQASVKGRKVTLSWKDNSNVEDGYRIFRGRKSGEYSTCFDLTGYTTCGDGTGTVEFVDEPGEGGWYYLVKGVKSGQFSDPTDEIYIFVNVPNAPSDFEVKLQGLFSVELSWKDNSSIETGYRLYRTVNGEQTVMELPANTHSYTDTPPPGEVVYRLAACTQDAESFCSKRLSVKIIARSQNNQPVVITSNVVKKGERFGLFSSEDGYASIYDIEGNLVACYAIKGGELKYIKPDLPAGLYYVVVRTSSEKTIKRKILIIK